MKRRGEGGGGKEGRREGGRGEGRRRGGGREDEDGRIMTYECLTDVELHRMILILSQLLMEI